MGKRHAPCPITIDVIEQGTYGLRPGVVKQIRNAICALRVYVILHDTAVKLFGLTVRENLKLGMPVTGAKVEHGCVSRSGTGRK